MPAHFIRIIPHSQLRGTDFFISLNNSDDNRWLPDACCAFYILWSHCAERWFTGKDGADGSLSLRDIEWLLDRRARTIRKLLAIMVTHGWLLERTDGRLELASFCLFFGEPRGALKAQARLTRGSQAQRVEQNQALSPPLDLDLEVDQQTTTRSALENPPARARVHSAEVAPPEEAVHPNEPEPPPIADCPEYEPAFAAPIGAPTGKFAAKRVLCVGEKNPVKPEKPNLQIVPKQETSHQAHEDAPQRTQEVAPMSEHRPIHEKPAETNVAPQDGSDEPLEVWAERELQNAKTPAARETVRSMIATMQRIGRGKLREGAEMGAALDRQKQAEAEAAAAEKARQAYQARLDARPLALPDVQRMLQELGVPGLVTRDAYRHHVTVGEVREVVAKAREDRSVSGLNAGLVNYRAQQLALERKNKFHAQCAAAQPPPLAVVAHVASALATG